LNVFNARSRVIKLAVLDETLADMAKPQRHPIEQRRNKEAATAEIRSRVPRSSLLSL
jgi:hypothetical protein